MNRRDAIAMLGVTVANKAELTTDKDCFPYTKSDMKRIFRHWFGEGNGKSKRPIRSIQHWRIVQCGAERKTVLVNTLQMFIGRTKSELNRAVIVAALGFQPMRQQTSTHQPEMRGLANFIGENRWPTMDEILSSEMMWNLGPHRIASAPPLFSCICCVSPSYEMLERLTEASRNATESATATSAR